MPQMFLNGTAMSGGADHHLVGGAELVARTTTAKRYRFHAVDGSYPGPRSGCPRLGEHTAEALAEAGLTGERIAELIATGAATAAGALTR